MINDLTDPSNVELDVKCQEDITLVTYPTLLCIVIKELIKYSLLQFDPSEKSIISITFSKKH